MAIGPETHFDRPKLIVIHGWGGTFLYAVEKVGDLFNFPCVWREGAFLIPRRAGMVARQLLGTPEQDRYVIASQKLIIGHLLLSSIEPQAAQSETIFQDVLHISEQRLFNEFAHFGIPIAPAARRARAKQLKAEALADLEPVLPCMERLRGKLKDHDGRRATEVEARDIIRESSHEAGLEGDLVLLLERIRDMHETGGDMDTVSSAVLYTHWLRSSAASQGKSLHYGRDYRYVFLNYHESLKHFAQFSGTDILIADLPIGALPSFDEDVRYLQEYDVRVERYEDHHPYTLEQKQILQTLVDDGLLGGFDLSGPLQNEELDDHALRCGADMVYDNTIAGTAWDCEGVRSIRHAAHCEDFVMEHSDLGAVVTKLIKGGACKVELTQILVRSISEDNALDRIHAREWNPLSDETLDYIESMKPALLENAFVLSFERAISEPAAAGGEALGPGSDMPIRPSKENAADNIVRILVALALQPEPGKPRLSVGKAIEYYAQSVPEADYLFYCHGARMLIARRINQADFTFNLGAMMPRIGGANDGGHGGAAVCRPDTNADYPQRLLGNVRASNFKNYVRYLQHRLAGLGYRPLALENRSVPAREQLQRGSKKLIAIMVVAALLGALLALLHPAYRRTSIIESNKEFFPHIASSTAKAENTP